MPMAPEPASARRAALEQLRFRKQAKDSSNASSTTSSSSTPPSYVHQPPFEPPPQSRDGTVSSRYFPTTPTFAGRVLVPSSSPLSADPSYHGHHPYHNHDRGDTIPGLLHTNNGHRVPPSPEKDLLSLSSGFVTPDAFSTRSHGSSSLPTSISSPEQSSRDGEPPRKRLNRGPSPISIVSSDPRDLFSAPGSPEILRPGQRRRPVATGPLSSVSSDESLSEASRTSPARARIIRGHRTTPPPPHAHEPSSPEKAPEDPHLTRFCITQPHHPRWRVRIAWERCNGDARAATLLLDDPSFNPPNPSLPPRSSASTSAAAKTLMSNPEMGRVKEVDEATKAERQRVRELGKKSMIYAPLKPQSAVTATATPPHSKVIPDTSKHVPPPSPSSPIIGRPPQRRSHKRKVVNSDSEPDWADSDGESNRSDNEENAVNEQKALEYFNSAIPEELQELTGCTPEQAAKIVALRPFASASDLRERLSQGRKKLGPAGVSPRMFEDCTDIFKAYGVVDSILARCEKQGAHLRAEIARWADHGSASKSKGKAKEKEKSNTGSGSGSAPSTSMSRSPSEEAEEGALSLRSQAGLNAEKPDYFISAQPVSLSPSLQLKEYQMLGINWLNLLYKDRISCILADEMGLGKTVQVISFLAHLKEKGSQGPHMIVVPSSTLENWLREFKRFAPGISVRAYYADKNNRASLRQDLLDSQLRKDPDGWEVLVTTYNLAQGDDKDRRFFRKIEWEACVFDEGHVLKNFQSQRYQALMKYPSEWRLLLTGTPLQNNLQELVSLMNFIMPEKFSGDMDSIRAVFKTKGDSKITLLAQQRVSRAKKMMTPFVLRRRKDQVLQDLPKKTERIEWCEMTPLQKSIYTDALRRSRKTIFDVEDAPAEAQPAANGSSKGKGTKKGRAVVPRNKDKLYLENCSNVLMDLRKAASHPMLFRRRFTDEVLNAMTKVLLKEPDFKKRGAIFDFVKEDMSVMTDSELQNFCHSYKSIRKFLQPEDSYAQAGKVQVLLRLLKAYQKDGRRVLIFSQFTQLLDILQRVLEREKFKFLVLTGSTPVDARQALVDEFTEDDSIPVFLLSTKAGGMGINLTAASVVIMFDQDFNPHNDKQAQDRAYRIGQKRDVEVIKLITKGSIEEDMLELGYTKLALDEAVAGDEDGEEKVEREMKTSLMKVVRKKLEETHKEDSEVLMDVDDS